MIKKIDKRIEKVLLSLENDPKRADDFFKTLSGNMERSFIKAENCFYLFLVFISVFLLTYTASIKKVSVLGIELTNTNSILVISLLLAAFLYYRFVTHTAYAGVIDSGLDTFYKHRFKEFHDEQLTELLRYPAFYAVEHEVNELHSGKSAIRNISQVWAFTLIILIFLLPIIALIWVSCLLITRTTVSTLFSISTTTLVCLLIIQSILNLIQGFRLIVD